jgi:hypothetical protein
MNPYVASRNVVGVMVKLTEVDTVKIPAHSRNDVAVVSLKPGIEPGVGLSPELEFWPLNFPVKRNRGDHW